MVHSVLGSWVKKKSEPGAVDCLGEAGYVIRWYQHVYVHNKILLFLISANTINLTKNRL